MARRNGESEAVAHAIEAHHNEVEPKTVEAVIVQIADAVSGARARGPRGGARALRDPPARPRGDRRPASGRTKVYAVRAGREVRAVVDPGAVDDEEAAVIARRAAKAIEKELDYPGRIKITVVRESRADRLRGVDTRSAPHAGRHSAPTAVDRIAPAWHSLFYFAGGALIVSP